MSRVILLATAVATLAVVGCDEQKLDAAKLITGVAQQQVTDLGEGVQMMLQNQLEQRTRAGVRDGSGDGNNYNHEHNYGGSNSGGGVGDVLRLRDGSCQDG